MTMNPKSIVSVSDLLHLTTAERIQLVEDLWDSIAAEASEDPTSVPVSAAQRDEVMRRSERHQAEPDNAYPLDEALERIDSRLR